MNSRLLNCPLKLNALVMVFLFGCVAVPAFAQEDKKPEVKDVVMSDLIRDHGQLIIQVGPFDKVEEDIRRLLVDVGMEGFSTYSSSLLPHKDVGLNMNSGMTVYSDTETFFNGGVIQFQIADRKALLDSLEADDDELPNGTWVDFGGGFERDLMMWIWPWANADSVQFHDDEMLVGDRSSFADSLVDAEPIKKRLHKQTADVLNRSGLSMLAMGADEFGFDDFQADDIVDYLEIDLSEPEKKWLEDCAEVVRATDLGVVGLKYHEAKTLEFRSFAQLKPEASFAKLVDLKAATQPWKADLGYEAENLIFSAAFKMDTFTSSAAPRLIPRAVTQGLAPNNLPYLRGGMMRILMSLCGDSWNELSAARIALYHTDEGSELGQMSVIGVLDAKDSQQVVTELQRIAALTSPMQNEERKFQRDEEIRKLIVQLASEDKTVSDRAYTRLGLVGEPAREQLRELRLKTEVQALKSRIDYLLNAMDRRKNRSHEVANAMFWTTLSPGLDFKQDVSTLGEYAVHHIEITPDPSKNEKEVANASQMMQGIFGPKWDQIQVVQVDSHFVFMLGSDQAKLERIVKRTAAGECELADQLKGVGHTTKVAQMQVWLNAAKVSDLTNQYRPNWQDDRMQELLAKDPRLSWVGLNIQEKGLGADFLIPVGQVIPFLSGF